MTASISNLHGNGSLGLHNYFIMIVSVYIEYNGESYAALYD